MPPVALAAAAESARAAVARVKMSAFFRGRWPLGCSRNLPMEAERLNALTHSLDDLEQRSAELRRYL